MRRSHNLTVLATVLLALTPITANGQDYAPQGFDQPPAAVQPQAYSQQQIDQLLAPIALYPDPLIAQILMAATYPLEVVDAHRWLQDPRNAALSGPTLEAALAAQPWDPSVKSLVAFPHVLTMMDNSLQWTEQLGDAFLASQPAVMDSVQRLRQLAHAHGNLVSTPQQTVVVEERQIIIQPANPQVIYVPYYNPVVVYGAWPWASYPPYYFPRPAGLVFANAIGFGIGLVVVNWLWGWNHWDWHRHVIVIDNRRFDDIDGHRHRFDRDDRRFDARDHHFDDNGARNQATPVSAPQNWTHDPTHRHGVPYRTPVVRDRFQTSTPDTRSTFRGFPRTENRVIGTPRTNTAAPEAEHKAIPFTGGAIPNTQALSAQPNGFGQREQQQRQRWREMDKPPAPPPVAQPIVTPPVERTPRTFQPQRQFPMAQPHVETPPQLPRQVLLGGTIPPQPVTQTIEPSPRSFTGQRQTPIAPPHAGVPAQPQHAPAPIYESFSGGRDVRMQSERGHFSRSSMPPHAQPAPQAARPATRNVMGGGIPDGGHKHNGGDGHDHDKTH